MSFSLLAAMMLATASAATPPGNLEALPPGGADLRPVGPEELSDFTIGDQSSEAPAQPPADTVPDSQTAAQPPARQPAARTADTSSPPVRPPQSSSPAPTQSAPIQQPDVAPSQPDSASSAPPPATTIAPPPSANIPPPSSRPLPGVAEAEGISPWYWALAALLAGLAGFAFLRQRRAAAANGADVDVTPEPLPEPQPTPNPEPKPQPTPQPEPKTAAPAQPAAPPPAPASDSVSIKMEPDLLLDLTPLRASLTDQEYLVDYALQIANRGNGPARKLGVDTALIMAGPEQEQKIAQFIAHPPDDGQVAIETLNSYGQAQMRGTLRIPLAAMTIIKLEDRQLIMPTVVLYPRYTGGRGKPHRFVIGRKPKEGDKLAPMRADLGPRTWRDLEARKA